MDPFCSCTFVIFQNIDLTSDLIFVLTYTFYIFIITYLTWDVKMYIRLFCTKRCVYKNHADGVIFLHLGTKKRHLVQKLLIFSQNYAKMEVKSVEKINRSSQNNFNDNSCGSGGDCFDDNHSQCLRCMVLSAKTAVCNAKRH